MISPACSSGFYAGLHAVLFLSAGLVLAAGLFTVAMFGHHQPTAGISPRPDAGTGEKAGQAR